MLKGGGIVNVHLSRYRILIDSRQKWYMKFFYHFLDIICVNSWICYSKKWSDENKTLAEFKEEIVLALCNCSVHICMRAT